MSCKNSESISLLCFALRVAEQSGDLIRAAHESRSRSVAFQTKGTENNLVTETDVKVEKFISSEIKKQYPSHKIIAEESHSGNTDLSDFAWVVDPLDGTNNFVHGIPFFCVSLALFKHNSVLVGVVHNPLNKETFYSTKDGGSFLKTVFGTDSIEVSPVRRLQSAVIAMEFGYDRTNEGNILILSRLHGLLRQHVQMIRSYGSCCLNMCFVACGRLDGFFEGRNHVWGPKIWDFAAAYLILKEAGGVAYSNFFDDDVDSTFDFESGQIICANSNELIDQMRIAFKKT